MVTARQTDERRPLRWLVGFAVAVWAAALVVEVRRDGIPVSRDKVLFWVLTLVVAVGLDMPGRLRRSLLVHWLPFALALVVYDVMRGQADNLSSRAHVEPAIAFDRFVFGGALPTLWLQEHLWRGTPSWYDGLLGVVYLSHFVIPLLLAVLLWRRDERAFLRWITGLLTLTAAAFVTYVVYPAVPPWLAAKQGEIPAVARIPGQSLRAFGIDMAPTALPGGKALSNPVAALPSLHAGVPFLIMLLFIGGAAWWLRALLLAYAFTMAFTLVYGGEHYVFDILMGWGYAAAVVPVVALMVRRRDARLLRRAPSEQLPPGSRTLVDERRPGR